VLLAQKMANKQTALLSLYSASKQEIFSNRIELALCFIR
jgi:hypothetical protein